VTGLWLHTGRISYSSKSAEIDHFGKNQYM
jgi:hypothetical protein